MEVSRKVFHELSIVKGLRKLFLDEDVRQQLLGAPCVEIDNIQVTGNFADVFDEEDIQRLVDLYNKLYAPDDCNLEFHFSQLTRWEIRPYHLTKNGERLTIIY